ncbi:uncharacterized protein LOC111000517 [Pieris rapae]|uniref:uncharacterized protein LOC111000517 n=1 Tax=Pieris rapae TaxID=64459 RepID=UPI001E2813F0|nr:uncharacterized protein LOC111000517 [Pieris rapae]
MAKQKASRLAGFVLIFVNFITTMLSLATFAIGLWVIISPKTLAHVIERSGPLKALFPEEVLTVQLGVGIAMLSIFFLFISVMGLYGAINCSTFLLFMYAALVLLLMLLDCAVFFYLTSNAEEKGVQASDGVLGHALQLALHCCDNGSDVMPWTCCETKNCSRETNFRTNCKDAMSNWLHHYGTIVYGSLIASHVILSSCSLLRRANSASRAHT